MACWLIQVHIDNKYLDTPHDIHDDGAVIAMGGKSQEIPVIGMEKLTS